MHRHDVQCSPHKARSVPALCPFCPEFCDAFLALRACGTALRAPNAPWLTLARLRPRTLASHAALPAHPPAAPRRACRLRAWRHGAARATANYSHSTNVYPGATTIYLNLRPGLRDRPRGARGVRAGPVEARGRHAPCGYGTELDVFAERLRAARSGVLPRSLERFEFYAACQEPDPAACPPLPVTDRLRRRAPRSRSGSIAPR